MSAPQRTGPLSSADMSVKLFVKELGDQRVDDLIPVFHRWIREGALEEELAIDVANYEHVPKGPGIVLICNAAHYYFDARGGRWGLRYRGRRESDRVGAGAIAEAFQSALRAAALLESDATLGGKYRFRTDELEFGIYDRLLAPSGEETFTAVRPVLEGCVRELFGSDEVEVELASGPKEPFMVSIRTSAPKGVSDLLGRLAASSA